MMGKIYDEKKRKIEKMVQMKPNSNSKFVIYKLIWFSEEKLKEHKNVCAEKKNEALVPHSKKKGEWINKAIMKCTELRNVCMHQCMILSIFPDDIYVDWMGSIESEHTQRDRLNPKIKIKTGIRIRYSN